MALFRFVRRTQKLRMHRPQLFCGSVWASGIESGLRMTPIMADQGRLLTRTLRAQPPREQLFIFGEWVLVLGLAAKFCR